MSVIGLSSRLALNMAGSVARLTPARGVDNPHLAGHCLRQRFTEPEREEWPARLDLSKLARLQWRAGTHHLVRGCRLWADRTADVALAPAARRLLCRCFVDSGNDLDAFLIVI